jgi:ADP-heptose:LPS heptosyltransferase
VRITVLRALPGLGDFLCLTPALRALREHHVTLVGLPQTRALAARYDGWIDELLDFPGFPGLPEVPLDPAATVAFLADRQREPADLVLQLHGSGATSMAFCELLGGRRVAGFVPGGSGRAGGDLLPWVERESEVLRPLRLLEHVGLPTAGRSTELPVSDEDVEEAEALAIAGPYAVLHPGSSLPDRRWPAARFAQVADALADRGLTPVLTGTPGEQAIVDDVAGRMHATPVDACGATSLGGMAALLRGARVAVVNDTGTSHLAAAVGAPSVVLFMVTDPARWAPLDRSRHRAVRAPARLEDVLREADDLLRASAARAAGSGP